MEHLHYQNNNISFFLGNVKQVSYFCTSKKHIIQ